MTALLPSIQRWQTVLIQEGWVQDPDGDRASLNQTVQLTLMRWVIWRILECWGIEPETQLDLATRSAAGMDWWEHLHEMGDRYHLPLLHPALPPNDPRRGQLPPVMCLPPEMRSALARELSSEPWTTALATDPAAVLDDIHTLPPLLAPGIRGRPSHRKSYGAYYTPPDVVHGMVEMALEAHRQQHGAIAPSIRILDPTCGFGVFLIAAYDYLEAHLGSLPRSDLPESPPGDPTAIAPALSALYGVDLDLQAVDVTKLLLVLTVLKHRAPPLAMRRALAPHLFTHLRDRIQWGNAVIAPDIFTELSTTPESLARICPLDWQTTFPTVMKAGGFDLVIGNPPYLDSEWMTRHASGERRYCTMHYESAVGNWDLFCVFIEQAFRLCTPGGFTSLLVPNKLLSADYAANTRRILAITNTLLRLRDYSQVPLFPVAVYPVVYLAQKQRPAEALPIQFDCMATTGDRTVEVHSSHPIPYGRFIEPRHRTWPTASADLFRLIDRIECRSTLLGAIATVCGAATVSEAYDIRALLQDNRYLDTESAIRMVNSGTIDRYATLWGRKPLRYLKQTYLHPVIPLPQQSLLPKTRQQQATQPKLIVASMTKVLECAIDLHGVFLAGKSTSIVQSAIALPYLLAILNSRLMSVYYAVVFGGNRLQGGYLRVGAAQLRSLPIPFPIEGFSSPFMQQGLAWVEQRIATPLELSDSKRQTHVLDQCIDQWVCQLYGLSADEIAVLDAHAPSV